MTLITIKVIRVGNPFLSPELSVEDTYTIARVKREIRSWKNVPIEQQMLVFYKTILEDDKTLDSYGVDTQSNIHLIIQTPGSLPITYRKLGTSLPLRVKAKDTIAHVKERISAKDGVAVNTFYLSFPVGVKLDDYATVVSSGLKANTEITYNNA